MENLQVILIVKFSCVVIGTVAVKFGKLKFNQLIFKIVLKLLLLSLY